MHDFRGRAGGNTRLQKQHPDKRVMLISEKGTMGVGSSGCRASTTPPCGPGYPAAPTSLREHCSHRRRNERNITHLSNDRGGDRSDRNRSQQLDRKLDSEGKPVLDANGEPELEQTYSVDTGTVLTINTKQKKLFNGETELVDASPALTAQKLEFIKAEGPMPRVRQKPQSFAADTLGIELQSAYAPAKEVTHEGQASRRLRRSSTKRSRGN